MAWRLAAGALAALIAATPAPAQDRVTLGRGTLLTNDLLGDGRDRWRTGSYSFSLTRGTEWTGRLPDRPLALTEWRLRGEIVAPARLTAPSPADRRYAGIATVGLHTHFARAGWDVAAGAELALVGPMTGLGLLQQGIHDAFGLPSPAAARAQQLPNAVHPGALIEVSRPIDRGGVMMRPFVEAQVGVETFARAGIDVTIGGFGRSDLTVRDSVTGHRYRATRTEAPTGLSFVFGGDIAHVAGSALLPGGGVQAEPLRTRLRAGFHWQGERTDFFYGISRLGREFQGQAVEQTVGAVHLRIRF